MASVNTTFATASYDKIQGYIDSGTLKYPSYVLCKDDAHKNTLIYIDKDLQMQPVKGYEQDSIIVVDKLPTENIRANAFYFCDGVGYLFVNNVPVPVFKNLDEVITSYDKLTDVPIVNKYGDATAPIVLSDLEDGNYAISGQYKLGNIETVYAVPRKVSFIIESDGVNKYITKFDGSQIVLYTVNLDTNDVIQDAYATQNWVLEHGFATENYVEQAMTDLYNRIAENLLITKVSQLENDLGYLTADDINGISEIEIAGLF